MKHMEKVGYADQQRGTLDPAMMEGAGPDARAYRDGARAARRDAEDGKIAGAEPIAAPAPDPEPMIIPPVHEKKKSARKRKPDGDEQQTAFL